MANRVAHPIWGISADQSGAPVVVRHVGEKPSDQLSVGNDVYAEVTIAGAKLIGKIADISGGTATMILATGQRIPVQIQWLTFIAQQQNQPPGPTPPKPPPAQPPKPPSLPKRPSNKPPPLPTKRRVYQPTEEAPALRPMMQNIKDTMGKHKDLYRKHLQQKLQKATSPLRKQQVEREIAFWEARNQVNERGLHSIDKMLNTKSGQVDATQPAADPAAPAAQQPNPNIQQLTKNPTTPDAASVEYVRQMFSNPAGTRVWLIPGQLAAMVTPSAEGPYHVAVYQQRFEPTINQAMNPDQLSTFMSQYKWEKMASMKAYLHDVAMDMNRTKFNSLLDELF